MRNFVCAFFFFIGFSGCSVHPLPEDVTRETTGAIVRRIRCEARDAIRVQLAKLLMESDSPRTRQIAAELASGARDLNNVYLRDIDPAHRAKMQRYYSVAIGYAFEFTIEERNVGTGESMFTLPFTQGTFTLGIKAGKDKSREAFRLFTIIDNVKDLAEAEFCSPEAEQRENLLYPITGNIGIEEMFATFYDLVSTTDKLAYDSKSPAFSDQLTFKTKISGGIKPTIELAAVKDHFKLTDASLDLSSERADQHRVTISIKLPDKFDQAGVKKSIADEIYSLRLLDAYRSRNPL